MSRRIQSIQLQATGAGKAPDTYFDRVVKYIPADIVAAWITITGLVKATTDIPSNTVLWVAFVVFLMLTAIWTWKQTEEAGQPPAKGQIILSTVSFAVWVFALGAPFDSLNFYHPIYSSLLLIPFSLMVGRFNP